MLKHLDLPCKIFLGKTFPIYQTPLPPENSIIVQLYILYARNQHNDFDFQTTCNIFHVEIQYLDEGKCRLQYLHSQTLLTLLRGLVNPTCTLDSEDAICTSCAISRKHVS